MQQEKRIGFQITKPFFSVPYIFFSSIRNQTRIIVIREVSSLFAIRYTYIASKQYDNADSRLFDFGSLVLRKFYWCTNCSENDYRQYQRTSGSDTELTVAHCKRGSCISPRSKAPKHAKQSEVRTHTAAPANLLNIATANLALGHKCKRACALRHFIRRYHLCR